MDAKNLYQFMIYCLITLFITFTSTLAQADPEVNMNVSQIIRYNGYKVEEYKVITKDGFVLGVQRIPSGKHESALNKTAKPVVFLQHGLLGSSFNWVANLPNQSLAFIMADAGFDVWLGNVRGNIYSRHHVFLKPSQEEFWAWSYDEMAKYDLPAMIEFALRTTHQSQLYYVGFSQGTMIAFASFSSNHILASKIKYFAALAPVANVGSIKSPIRYLSYFAYDFQLISHLLGYYEFLPGKSILQWLASYLCRGNLDPYCSNILFIIAGYDDHNGINKTRLPIYLSHTPAGTSVRNMVHFAQGVLSHRFQMFDYGNPSDNLKYYGQPMPPQYSIKTMNVPTILCSGRRDWLADPRDVSWLQSRIQNLVYHDVTESYDHLDFIWASDALNAVYKKMIKYFLRDYYN